MIVFSGLQHGLGGNSTSSQAQAQAQAHMMQFNPLLYSYQLSMAHQLGKMIQKKSILIVICIY